MVAPAGPALVQWLVLDRLRRLEALDADIVRSRGLALLCLEIVLVRVGAIHQPISKGTHLLSFHLEFLHSGSLAILEGMRQAQGKEQLLMVVGEVSLMLLDAVHVLAH